MPDFHRRSTTTQSAALIVGGTAGALIRYAVATAWPNPQQMLVSTTLTAAVAFMVAGYLLATGMKCALHYLVFGVCVSAASLSAWAILTIDQPMRLSLAFLILTPVAAIIGLLCGLAVARAVAR
ncbi:chromosome condensation protein CrcB [Mycolicibacterium gilvum]|uniref:chromosome condensation protein CrcB n=1 Tax=Mycolicibacterium gilvum TaxID=1804 RepID=UPI004046721C